jgi:hypothetical protein
MNFTEVVTEVMGVLKRSDKLLDVRREVNSAINQFCMDANFQFDLAELSPAIVTTELTQALPLSTFARFRKFAWLKRGGTRCFISKLERAELLKGTACDMRDKYYIVGTNVNLSLADYANTVDVSWFQAPPTLTDAAPDFWMLELSPYMVIDRTLAKLFTAIGDDATAQRHEAFALSAFRTANKDYGTSTQ